MVSYAVYLAAAGGITCSSLIRLADMGVSKNAAGFILMSEAVTLGMFMYGVAAIDRVETSALSLAAAWVLVGWLLAASFKKVCAVGLLTVVSICLFVPIAVFVLIHNAQNKALVLLHVVHRVVVDGWWVLCKYKGATDQEQPGILLM